MKDAHGGTLALIDRNFQVGFVCGGVGVRESRITHGQPQVLVTMGIGTRVLNSCTGA